MSVTLTSNVKPVSTGQLYISEFTPSQKVLSPKGLCLMSVVPRQRKKTAIRKSDMTVKYGRMVLKKKYIRLLYDKTYLYDETNIYNIYISNE